jgi:hypothetical protein
MVVDVLDAPGAGAGSVLSSMGVLSSWMAKA